jgi:hypothetical protein
MSKLITIKAKDPRIRALNFKPYRSTVERRFTRFQPGPGEPDRMEVATPWGESLTVTPGDYLVSELDAPDHPWPVDADIFAATYEVTRPGYCIKRALTDLAPLVDLTGGDPEQLVIVYTKEGPETVRAGDFYLARGIKNEIWPIPKEKVGTIMIPAE